ncbi:MAG: peptidoglycan-binding protein [Cyanobacteria bacterium P01_E01_bin.42]
METIAYTRGYLVREEIEGIEYDFPEIDWLSFGKKAMGSSLLAMAVVAGILAAADPAMARMLTRGMQGNDVAEVQMLLRNRGYAIRYGANGAGRGKFGPQTENAVRAFQQQMGLTPDGVVGDRTLIALKNGTGGRRQNNASVGVAPSNTGGRYLTIGSRGNEVAELQTLLRNRGYAIRYGASGAGRGVFGQQTLTALRQFQQDARLSVDGVAGPRTMSALRSGSVAASSSTVRQANVNVRQANASTSGRLRVTTGGSRLNIRNRPSLNSGVVGTLANGATVNAIGRPSSGWVQIGSSQFVASRYLR